MAVLIKGETLYVAWLGDSQVLLSKAGQPCLLMNPHKPNREVTKSFLFALCLHDQSHVDMMYVYDVHSCVTNSCVPFLHS